MNPTISNLGLGRWDFTRDYGDISWAYDAIFKKNDVWACLKMGETSTWPWDHKVIWRSIIQLRVTFCFSRITPKKMTPRNFWWPTSSSLVYHDEVTATVGHIGDFTFGQMSISISITIWNQWRVRYWNGEMSGPSTHSEPARSSLDLWYPRPELTKHLPRRSLLIRIPNTHGGRQLDSRTSDDRNHFTDMQTWVIQSTILWLYSYRF